MIRGKALRRMVALCAALSAGTAMAQSIDSLAVFGDNIADPGNIPGYLAAGNAAGLGPFDTDFPPSPPYFGNRFSNGPVAAEYLAGLLGVPAGNVGNLAVGNAFSAQLPVSLAGGVLIGNGSSIPGPIGRGLSPLNGTDVASQVGMYLAARGPLSADDLMLLYASANDGALALNTVALTGLEGAAAGALIQAGAQANSANTAQSARSLIDAGARQVVIALLPDIGRTPAAAAGGLSGVAAGTLFSQLTNAGLVAEAAAMNAQTPAVVTVFDSFTLLADIVANPGKYGLSNVTDPCLLVPSCTGDPAAADQFLFWDAFFPTTAVHAITAAAIADTIHAPKSLAGPGESLRFAAGRFSESLLRGQEGSASALHVSAERLDRQRDGETFSFGYDLEIDRLTVGARIVTDGPWRYGVALAIDDGEVSLAGLPSGFELDSLRVGVAAGRRVGPFEIDGVASWGNDDVEDIFRETGVAGQVARGGADADSFSYLLQASLPFEHGAWWVAPRLRVGHGQAEVDGYTETGAVALEQQVDDRESESSYAEIGVLASSNAEADWRSRIGLYYRTELSDDDQRIASRLVSLPEVTRVLRIATPDDHYFRVEVGLARRLTERLDVTFDAEAIDGADLVEGWGVSLGLAYRW